MSIQAYTTSILSDCYQGDGSTIPASTANFALVDDNARLHRRATIPIHEFIVLMMTEERRMDDDDDGLPELIPMKKYSARNIKTSDKIINSSTEKSGMIPIIDERSRCRSSNISIVTGAENDDFFLQRVQARLRRWDLSLEVTLTEKTTSPISSDSSFASAVRSSPRKKETYSTHAA